MMEKLQKNSHELKHSNIADIYNDTHNNWGNFYYANFTVTLKFNLIHRPWLTLQFISSYIFNN